MSTEAEGEIYHAERVAAGERARADLRAVVEAQESEEWWELRFTLGDLEVLDEMLYYASCELDRRIRDMEPEKNESSGQQRYYARLVLERVELGLLRNRVRGVWP